MGPGPRGRPRARTGDTEKAPGHSRVANLLRAVGPPRGMSRCAAGTAAPAQVPGPSRGSRGWGELRREWEFRELVGSSSRGGYQYLAFEAFAAVLCLCFSSSSLLAKARVCCSVSVVLDSRWDLFS